MQRLFARFQATCVSVQTQAAVVEAASLEAAEDAGLEPQAARLRARAAATATETLRFNINFLLP